MRLTQLTLTDFLLVKDSGISKIVIDFNERVQIILGTNGSGKAQPLSSHVKTPDGWVYMRDLKEGDLISTPDGGSASVVGIYPQGVKDIYKITFEDGRSARCCEEHLWRVYSAWWYPKSNNWRTHSLREIMDLNNSWLRKAGLFVQLIKPEEMADVELPIDPYLLGVLLGDGSFVSGNVTISTPDDFIVDEIKRIMPSDLNLNKVGTDDYSFVKKEQGTRWIQSSIKIALTQLGLFGKYSYEKTIPDIYLKGAPSQRLALLQGLLDTDGTVGVSAGRGRTAKVLGKGGTVQFCTTSGELAKQVQYLIRSLGGLCKISNKTPFFSHNGERKKGRDAYILFIRYNNPIDLFRLPRKKERLSENYQFRNRLRLRIRDIEFDGREEAQCIMVDHPDHLYITNDFISTHNTQIMRQLSCYPPSRSLFEKTGHKALTVETEGHCYSLESDFQKPSSPHLFTDMDTEENLNIGRTTDEQKDLIATKIGITPFIDSLMMNTINFPKMKPSERQKFLMAHNPDDIGFVLGLAKQMSSKVKACKNNLNHLQARKIILEQKLLSPEAVIELEQEREKISRDLSEFQQNLMDIEIGMRGIGTTAPLSIYDIKTIKNTLRTIRYSLLDLQMVDRDDSIRSERKSRLKGSIESALERISTINDQLLTYSQELNELEVQYKELAPDGDLQEAESVVSRLEAERDRFRTERPDFELSQDDLAKGYIFLDSLQDVLTNFESCDIPLYSRKKRSHREQIKGQLQYRQSAYQMQRNDLQTQYDELSKRHTITPSDIPEKLCSKGACPLYSHFMEGYQTTEHKRQNIKVRIEKLEYRLKRIRQYLEMSHRYFEQSQFYQDKITWIVDQSRSNPVLHKVLMSMDLLTTLSTSPNRIALRLKDAYDHIDQWMRYKTILSDLETAYSLRNRFLGSQNADTVKLVVTIDTIKKTLSELRKDLETNIQNKKRFEEQLTQINRYEMFKKTALDIQNTHIEYMKLLADHHEKQCLSFLKTKIEALRSDLFSRMSDVERSLREQSGLQERYQEEVVSQIERIEIEKSEQERIEKTLIAIPRENTIGFVNNIFKQANVLIESIWTVPFKIELLKDTDPLDYTFQISGDNDSLREMSECSEGQTEILYLAINLALRIQLGHVNIPLCLDETGRTFDTEHKRRLILVLKKLLDDKVISQLFYISHDLNLVTSLGQAEFLVIKDTNIVVPEISNLHCTIQ